MICRGRRPLAVLCTDTDFANRPEFNALFFWLVFVYETMPCHHPDSDTWVSYQLS